MTAASGVGRRRSRTLCARALCARLPDVQVECRLTRMLQPSPDSAPQRRRRPLRARHRVAGHAAASAALRQGHRPPPQGASPILLLFHHYLKRYPPRT